MDLHLLPDEKLAILQATDPRLQVALARRSTRLRLMRPGGYRPRHPNRSRFGWLVFTALSDARLCFTAERLVLPWQRLLESEKSGATEF
jgi:hypothetical protein